MPSNPNGRMENDMMQRREMIAGLAAAGLVTRASAQAPIAVRYGWQPTTTVQAQIAHTLNRTDILESQGLAGAPTMFSFGPAVNEGLISGAIDLGFIGDLPSVSLTATGAPISIIGRMSTFRGSILATPESGITGVAGLRGKRLYGPVGSGIHLAALGMLQGAGLTPGRDVEVINMAFPDIADALRAKRVEAVFVWDPWISLYETAGLARVVQSDTGLTMVVAARQAWLRANPEGAARFLRAQKRALLWAATHKAQANAWFREPEAARALPEALVEAATGFDPQWGATGLSDARVAFSPAELARYQGLARSALDLRLTPRLSPVAERLDLSVAMAVDAETAGFDPASVRVRS